MLLAVSIAGACLLALGLADKRARPMALLLGFVWLETAIIDAVTTVDAALALKPVVDFVGGVMALSIVTRERWSLMVPALFALMLLSHAAYWMAWQNGVDLWYAYPHAVNALWLLQLAAVAWPRGERIVGLASSYLGARLPVGRSVAVRRFVGSADRDSDKENIR